MKQIDYESGFDDKKQITRKNSRREVIKKTKKISTIRSKGCIKKFAYQTKKIALQKQKQIMKDRGVEIYIYKCPWCHYFHLTHQKQRNLNRRHFVKTIVSHVKNVDNSVVEI